MANHTHLNKAELRGMATGEHEWGKQKLATMSNRAFGEGCTVCKHEIEQLKLASRPSAQFGEPGRYRL